MKTVRTPATRDATPTGAPPALVRLAVTLLLAGALVAALTPARAAPEEAPRETPAEAPSSRPAATSSASLSVYATGQSLGALEPCECVEGMAGGFPRRLALLAREATLRAGPRLVVDLGDLTGAVHHPKLLELKTRAALELLARSEAIVAVGDQDLRLGAEPLARLAREAKATLLCANLSAGGERPFPGSVRRELSGVVYRIVALLDPLRCPPELSCEAPEVALERELRAGERGIVLFHGEPSEARALAKVPGVVLIVSGQDQQEQRPLRRLGGVPLVEVLRDARAVSRVELRGEDATLVHLVLDGRIPDDRWAQARVERYYQEVAGLPEPKRRPTPAGGGFVGAQTCGGCHTQQYAVFKRTKHHGAQARVRKQDPKRAKLGECTVCHVTGFGFEGGFRDFERTGHLAEVGCESCHGVGGSHALKGGGRGYGVKAGFPNSWKPVCVGCHDPTNSPHFDFEKGLERIRHWKPR